MRKTGRELQKRDIGVEEEGGEREVCVGVGERERENGRLRRKRERKRCSINKACPALKFRDERIQVRARK